MLNNFYYRVNSMLPANTVHSNCNFSTYLKGDFAKKAFKEELNESFYQNLQERGKNLIKINFNEKDFEPYHFVENSEGKFTNLLRGVFVPGDACDLSIDGGNYGRILDNPNGALKKDFPLIYVPHNIDNPLQASTTLMLRIEWATSLSLA